MRPTVQKISRFLLFYPGIFVNDPAYQLATLRHAPEMSDIIWEVKQAFKKGIAPIKSEHGTSSTFILRGEDERPVAIFKLDDPSREYAAFRLDHKNFANVPPTVLTTLYHAEWGGEATGSCQLFVEDAVTAIEFSSKAFKEFSASGVRRMAQLDIRIINADRHTSNILIRNKKEIIPIDHGFILTTELFSISFPWVSWEQARTPFSPEEKEYISSLDPEKDRVFLIEEVRLPEKVANRHYLASMLLKIGANSGFYPNEIGDMLSKSYHRNAPQSKFEFLIERLLERNAENWAMFIRYANDEIEAILEEYETNKYRDFSIIGRVPR